VSLETDLRIPKKNGNRADIYCIIIPDPCRVQGHIVVGVKYVTGRKKRLRPHKVYTFLI